MNIKLWLLISGLTLIAIVYFVRQPLVSYQNGLFFDAKQYYLIAERSADMGPVSGVSPLVYRIGLPWLIGWLASDNIVNGFKLANFTFGIATVIVFVFLLREVFKAWWLIFLLGLLFIINLNSPFRFNAFYPVMTDPPLIFFSTLILYIHIRSKSYTWPTIAVLSVVTFVGVLFREVTLLAPVAIYAAYLITQIRAGIDLSAISVQLLYRSIPVVSGIIALSLTHHLVVATSSYTYLGQARQLLQFHWQHPLTYLLTPLATYGPLLLLAILFSSSSTGDFVKRYPSLPIYMVGVLCLTLIGGYHGTRLMFWGYVAVLPMIGMALVDIDERYPIYLKICILVPIALAQFLAQNPLGLVPDFTGSPVPKFPEFYWLFPYGENAHYSHLDPHTMGVDLRWQMLFQYLVIALYLGLIRVSSVWMASK